MALINREIINPNLVVKFLYNNKIVDFKYKDIIRLINKAKSYLVNEKNCTPGQKVLLATNGWPQYLIWFIACSELGLAFVVSDHPNIDTSKSVGAKLNLYGEIDFIIGQEESDIFTYFPERIDRLIDRDAFFPYDKVDQANTHWATPETIILYATSSGTTDTPKIVKYRHRFFYDLLERNAKLYNLKETDKCLHTKGLHHGSVTGVYFLPTIKYCATHYYARAVDILEPIPNETNWVELIQQEKINHCLMFYKMADTFSKLASLDQKMHDDLNVYVLSKITNQQVDVIVKQLGYKMLSIFGCTETSGPLFLPEINPDNASYYDPNNFGKELDDFFGIALDKDNLLTITMPDGSITCTGDKFSRINGNYIFEGREHLYRINGLPIYLNIMIDVIAQILEMQHGEQFDLVFDGMLEKVYIRSDVPVELSDLNYRLRAIIRQKHYEVSKNIVGPRDDFFNGIKFDPEEVRIRCREIG